MSYLGQVELKSSEIRRIDVTSSTSATHKLTWTPPSEQSLIITINGIKQQNNYSIAGTTLTLDDALLATDKMEVIGILDIGEATIPPDDSITNAMVKSDAAIALSKLATDPSNASNLASGTVPTARLGSGSASSSTILYGDNTWAAPPAEYNDAGLQDDIALLGFKVASNGSLAKYNLVDQTIDAFEDASGVDASTSTNETRNTSGNYYSGASAATGGTVTTDGGDSIHTFLLAQTGTAFVAGATATADVLVVAGGGGAGQSGGGGGGGGVVFDADKSISAASYTVTVGDGGAGGSNTYGTAGGNSVFSDITANGGGAGGYAAEAQSTMAGGSGGGAGPHGGNKPGGIANQTASGGDTGYGNDGGDSFHSDPTYWGAGGGGAGAVGQDASSGVNGSGGNGQAFDISGASVTYAGGGGGAGGAGGSPATPGSGGTGGGGDANTGNGVAGTDGLGGGGGSGRSVGVASGGSGVVIIRFTTGAFDSYNNMTLVSNATTAVDGAPTTGDIVLTYTDGAGTATVNTDIKAYISRDGSAYSSAVTLVSQGTTGGHTILTANGVDLSGIASGTSMRWKIETLNQSVSKQTRIHAVSLGWS